MRRIISVFLLMTGAVTMAVSLDVAAKPDERTELLKVREAVWRAWFSNDAKTLEQLVPADTLVINSGQEKWQKQADVLKDAADFQAAGGKLIRLEFPRTEIQSFGDVAVTYSDFSYEIEEGGKRSVTSGRATEIFVRRHGKWTNPGWHTDHHCK
jgi:ketosteroid isomerase-like protein